MEEFIIFICICLQFFFFTKTLVKIRKFRKTIPIENENKDIKLRQKAVPGSYLKNMSLIDVKGYDTSIDSSEEEIYNDDYINSVEVLENVNYLELDASLKSNVIFDEVINGLNVYLLRNKGAVADFNLMKDIVERNVDAEEAEIDQRLTIPLYIGLCGTIIGICFGLHELSNTAYIQNNTSGFLSAVGLAMSCSLLGIVLSTLNSSIFFPRQISRVENCKNRFYTFIQTNLLPVLGQNVSSSIINLNDRLSLFTSEFGKDLNRLEALLNKNYKTLDNQRDILNSLENLNITSFANANIKILKQLEASTEKLEHFNIYLNDLNNFHERGQQVARQFELVISKIGNWEEFSSKLTSAIETNTRMVQFFNDHQDKFEAGENALKSAVGRMDDTIYKSFDILQAHINMRIESLKTVIDNTDSTIANQLDIHVSELENFNASANLKLQEEFGKNQGALASLKQIGDLKSELLKISQLIKDSNITNFSTEIRSFVDSSKDWMGRLENIEQKMDNLRVKSSIKELFFSSKS